MDDGGVLQGFWFEQPSPVKFPQELLDGLQLSPNRFGKQAMKHRLMRMQFRCPAAELDVNRSV
jgi:hypothetical protein